MEIQIIVEIPQGSRNTYEMDHARGLIRLDRIRIRPRTRSRGRSR